MYVEQGNHFQIYKFWLQVSIPKTGLPDVHPKKPDFQISILKNRTSRVPKFSSRVTTTFFRTEISSLIFI
jgi:hypothetical protein